MKIFAYIVAFFSLPMAFVYGGNLAIDAGLPRGVWFVACCVSATCFAWHCAVRLTAGRNW